MPERVWWTMREALGDIGFRGTKGKCIRWIGFGDHPNSPSWRCPRRRHQHKVVVTPATWRRGLGFWVCGVGEPYPSLYRWRVAGWEEGVLPQLGLLGRRVEGGGLPPQVGFLLSLHQANLPFDFFKLAFDFQTTI